MFLNLEGRQPGLGRTYPGVRVKAVALENENGCLIYSVWLSNGLEVKIDAGNGRILRSATEDDEDQEEPKIQRKSRKSRRLQ